MKTRFRIFRFLKIVFCFLIFSLFVLSGAYWYFIGRGPVAHSDVPITPDIGNWPYQHDLKITEFTAEAVDANLGLFENRFLMRFHIKGILLPPSYPPFDPSNPYRGKIVKAQLTARVVDGGFDPDYKAVADVLIVPIVQDVKDSAYKNQEVPFDLTLEHVFVTMNWGSNVFNIRCGDKSASVTVLHPK